MEVAAHHASQPRHRKPGVGGVGSPLRTFLFPYRHSNPIEAKGHRSSSRPPETPGPVLPAYMLDRKEVLCPLCNSR